jgi:hypothetical protein
VYAATVGLYLGVLFAAAAWLGRKTSPGVAARIPAVFVAIHFGFAWGFIKEMVTRRAVP